MCIAYNGRKWKKIQGNATSFRGAVTLSKQFYLMGIFGVRGGRDQALIYVLALVKFVLPFLLQHSAYEPHRDEFLYLAEAHHLAWGYLELPPMLGVLSLIAHLFGGSLFWIKFWPSLGGAL